MVIRVDGILLYPKSVDFHWLGVSESGARGSLGKYSAGKRQHLNCTGRTMLPCQIYWSFATRWIASSLSAPSVWCTAIRREPSPPGHRSRGAPKKKGASSLSDIMDWLQIRLYGSSASISSNFICEKLKHPYPPVNRCGKCNQRISLL